MYELMKLTAWGMEKPKPYHAFHLIFVIVGLSLCVFLAWLFRKASEKTNKIILVSCGAFLVITEIYKQLFYTFYIGGGDYQWWIFPFQLCSVPMYLCLIAPFIKKESVRGWLYTFLATYNLVGGFISLFEPSGLCHEYVTLTLHAFVWHIMLVFIGFYLIASGRAGKRLIDFLPSIGVFGALAIFAQIINFKFGDRGVNMFYISLLRDTPLAVFKDITLATNRFVNMILYMFALTLGAFVFFVIGLYLRKLVAYIKGKKKAK